MRRTIVLLLLLCSNVKAAEFLIYDMDNWMDKLDPTTLKKYLADGKLTQEEYDNRDQRGDIIEVRPDGFWNTRGCGKGQFRVVKVPGLAVEDVKEWGTTNEYGRRKYAILNNDGKDKQVISLLANIQLKDTKDEKMVDPTTAIASYTVPSPEGRAALAVAGLGLAGMGCFIGLLRRSRCKRGRNGC